MALELFGGAALGALAGELLKKVLELKHRVTIFEATLTRLESTLEILCPLIQVIEDQCSVLGRPDREIQRLAMIRIELKNGNELVSKCFRVWSWDIRTKIRYEKRLEKLDESLRRFLSVDMQALMVTNVNEILLAMRRIVHHFALDSTKLTVRIAEIDLRWTKVNVAMIHFHCPTDGDIFPEGIRGSRGLEYQEMQKIYMGQTRFILDECGVIVRGKFCSGKFNECTIRFVSDGFEGCIIGFSTESDSMKINYGVAAYGDFYYSYGSCGEFDCVIHTLYEGLVWEQPQEQSIRRDSATICLGRDSSLPRILSSIKPSSSELAALEFQKKHYDFYGMWATLRNPDSESSSRSYYNCKYYNWNSCQLYIGLGDSSNSDNREKKNDEIEETSRKCESLMQRLHVLQDTVSGLKLLILTSVMVCFLSLIMNFVILMSK